MLIRPLPFLVYLLHIDPPVARARHYLGLCRHDRLAARLREHGGGHGASLTAQAVERGCGLYLVHAEYVRKPENEKLLKQRGHYRSMCPVCSKGLDLASPLAQSFRVATRSAATPWHAKGW